MKTQTYGSASRANIISFSGLFSIGTDTAQWFEAEARKNYRYNRENGSDSDNPNRQFPYDGKITWIKGTVKDDGYVYGIKENDGYYHYEVRYDEGPKDKQWMAEKDKNYLGRLEKKGKLKKKEPKEFLKRQKEQLQERLKQKDFVITENKSKKQLQLLNLLKNNTSVKTLYLKGLALESDVIKSLFQLLVVNKTIKALDLSNCSLNDEKIKPLIDILRKKQNTSLIELKLDGNDIKKTYCFQINSYLKRNALQNYEKKGEGQEKKSNIDIPKDYECSITSQIMLDPVFTADGETYEREAISEWLKDKNTSPKTNLVLEHKNLTPNKNAKGLILSFLDKHPELWQTDLIYKSKGLKAKLLEAISSGNTNDIKRYVDMDKRFLWAPLEYANTLLKLALQDKPKVLATVISLLSNSIFGDLFWEQLENDDGTECFLQAAKSMGVEGAKIIAQKLDWTEANFQAELFNAIKLGDAKIAKICLTLGAKLDVKDSAGNYPIHLVVLHNKLEVLKFLISEKANLEALDANGDTPLLVATKNTNLEPLKGLIFAKANVNALDKDNNTLLHYAAKLGNLDIIELLIKSGADTKLKNNQQQKPGAVARAFQKFQAAELIDNLKFQLKFQLNIQPYILPLQKKIFTLEEIIKSLGGKIPEEKKLEIEIVDKPKEKKPLVSNVGVGDKNVSDSISDKKPSAPSFFDTKLLHMPKVIIDDVILKLKQLFSANIKSYAMEKISQSALEEVLLSCLKSSEILKRKDLPDKIEQISRNLAFALVDQFELTPNDDTKIIVLTNLKDKNVSSTLQDIITKKLTELSNKLVDKEKEQTKYDNSNKLK